MKQQLTKFLGDDYSSQQWIEGKLSEGWTVKMVVALGDGRQMVFIVLEKESE